MIEEPTKPSKDENPKVKVEYTEFEQTGEPTKHLNEIDGVISTVSSTPTKKPRRLIEQFKIKDDNSICAYDVENGEWFCVNNGYAGVFDSNGDAGTPFPTGWSVSRTGTGAYLITHNLNTTSYVVVATPTGYYNIVEVASRNANTFELYSVDRATGSSANTAMCFIVRFV